MTSQQHAEQQLAQHREERRALAKAYARLFTTEDGRRVLADLERVFNPRAARFPAAFTKGNPLAAFFGGIHYDGSAAVMNHISDRIAEATEPEPEPPTITTH